MNAAGPSSIHTGDMDVDSVSTTPLRPSSVVERPRASSVPLHQSGFTVGYPERISHIYHALTVRRHTKKMKWLPIRPVRKEEALLVHSEDHWDKVQAIQEMTDQERIDSEEYYEQLSLYVMQGTTRAALLSCGGVIEACLAVARNELKKTFAIVRPPGHHAEPDEHMGFCFFNNVAVAARVVQQLTPIKKIMILDWCRAFNDDPTVLYVSLHRYEQGTFYPCGPFGGLQSCGEGPGLGYSVNIPWPEKGMTDADYIHAFQKVIMPIAMEFAPELVIISAGFDAAQGDDLGECHVSPTGYAHMTHMLSGLAGGRLVVALEGGYNLDSISNSALAVVGVLLGEAPDQLPPMVAGEAATETVFLVAREQSKYWKSVDPKACEPREGLEEISFSIPEILKAHRQHYLYTQHEMMQIPLINAELEKRFSTQIMCTSDIFENDTLVIFVHEFGNLRLEVQSSTTFNVELERSYLLDFSKELVAWIKKEGYSLLDANLFPKPAVNSTRAKTSDDFGRDIVTYLWDNYVQLSSARRVIIIGHGPGSRPIMELLERRTASVMKTVRAIIQIVGHSTVPATPKYADDVTEWYRKNSFIVIPSTHRILGPEVKPKDLRRHGELVPIDESQPVKLVLRALPGISQFVNQQLGKNPVPTS
ncbi:histone deacetylase complex protein [Lyophyllum atratum]|nr:histone deacetylase complex protein [Lyophyllum atratum]